MVLPRWRGLNSSKFCKNSVDFSSVTDIIKAMHYLSCLKSLPGSYFLSLSPATATNFDSWSVVFSNIRKVVTVPPTMSRKFDGLEVGCIVFCAKFIFLFLLLLLPLLPIAFHWSLQKKLIPGFVRSSVLFTQVSSSTGAFSWNLPHWLWQPLFPAKFDAVSSGFSRQIQFTFLLLLAFLSNGVFVNMSDFR